MGKTSISAKVHMREWSEFFRDISEASYKAVEELVESKEKKRFLKQSLERLIKKGYIEEKEGKFKKTKLGQRFFAKYFPHPVQVQPVSGGHWYLLSFDVPTKENKKRIYLTRILKKYNFQPLQRSVWVGSNKMAQDIWEFIVENKMEKYCFPMIVEIVEGEERLLKLFNKK
jgi:DNA-binding transcriptional regulator PaaX